MKNPIQDGEWYTKEGDSYLITGTDVYGEKFRKVTNSSFHMQGINLYCGKKYLVRDGHKVLICEVTN